VSGVIAVIPARGGSKGVPGKNVQPVGGIPLIARAVNAANAATLIDTVYVSTDDAAIAAATRAAGGEVIDRPADIAGDTASSEAALLHALKSLDAQPDILVFIQATSPFIEPADLDAAVARVRAGTEDVVFAAKKSHVFIWRETPDGADGVNHDKSFRLRRQDSEPQFAETGAFYVMRVDGFLEREFRFFGRVGIQEVPELTAVEIDSHDDLAMVRALAQIVDRPGPIDVDAVVTDFDGVHTDDTVLIDRDGVEFTTVSRKDGMGVGLLKRAGVPMLILSTEVYPLATARASKLGIEVQQGLDDKLPALERWAAEKGIDLARIAYLGNDVNDLGCLRVVGWPIAVADAHRQVLEAARVVLDSRGGDGAVRELADRILTGR
jgi:N-acylneuraminate cytidylyltransferase